MYSKYLNRLLQTIASLAHATTSTIILQPVNNNNIFYILNKVITIYKWVDRSMMKPYKNNTSEI